MSPVIETLAPPRTRAENWMRSFQDWLCYRLELADGGSVKFTETWWEHAGGGIFFDRLTVGRDGCFEELVAFVQDVGEAYGRVYAAIMRQNRDLPYTERQKQWQQVR